jgi:hypothetical protein
MLSNLGSALVLMTAGDVMAQSIEIRKISEEESLESLSHQLTTQKVHHDLQRTVSFRRYGTISPDVEDIQHKLREKHKDKEGALVLLLNDWKEYIKLTSSNIHDELSSLDYFRTGTMGFWAVAAYTPYYVGLYQLYDRYLPKKKTPLTVMTRVGLTFVASIPFNATFFCYGSFVHHLTEWTSLLQEWQMKMEDSEGLSASYTEIAKEFPFDFEMAWCAARLKLENELLNTVIASGAVWIPINILNFSVMPPHLQPLALFFCSAFWNCYLSLAQHRDADLALDADE